MAETEDQKTQRELAELMVGLSKDEKIGKTIKRRITELNPARRFADVEADDLRADLDKFKADTKAERDQEKALARQEAARHALTSRYGDEDIAKIEELMTTNGIGDYELGARLYAAEITPARPTHETKSKTWQAPSIKLNELDNLNNTTLDKAYAVVDQLRGRNVH